MMVRCPSRNGCDGRTPYAGGRAEIKAFCLRPVLHRPFRMLVDDGTEGLSGEAIGLAIEIHKKYGPGLLENAYVRSYADRLRKAGHEVDCQPRLPLLDGATKIG